MAKKTTKKINLNFKDMDDLIAELAVPVEQIEQHGSRPKIKEYLMLWRKEKFNSTPKLTEMEYLEWEFEKYKLLSDIAFQKREILRKKYEIAELEKLFKDKKFHLIPFIIRKEVSNG